MLPTKEINKAVERRFPARGIDICMVRGNQLCRDEAFMETTALQDLTKREL